MSKGSNKGPAGRQEGTIISPGEIISFLDGPLREAAANIASNLEEPLRALREQAARHQHLVESIAESFERLNPALAKASAIMSRHGWWLVGFLSLDFYVDLATEDPEFETESLTEAITSAANRDGSRELEGLVGNWAALEFAERKKIFEDALWAHKQGKYTLTVPTLVVHVEGIIRAIVDREEGFTSWQFEKVVRRFESRFDSIEKSATSEEVTVDEASAIINYYNLAALQRLRVVHPPDSKSDPADLNRHALSHGRWLAYSSLEYSTKLFLLLDMLHSMLEQYQTDS